jgi:signal transduction histidine kinase
MDHQLDRLSRLIDDLLDASRASSGKLTLRFEDLDVGLLLSDVSSRFATQFQEAKISFKLNTTKDIQIHGDANRLEQVISNLYTNAIRYASGSWLESSAQVVDGEVQIKVQDSGPGISPEAQSRIFARFERADFQNKAAGLGLGLYIAKQIVDGHKGIIRVDSSPGKGATFTIRLPLKPC